MRRGSLFTYKSYVDWYISTHVNTYIHKYLYTNRCTRTAISPPSLFCRSRSHYFTRWVSLRECVYIHENHERDTFEIYKVYQRHMCVYIMYTNNWISVHYLWIWYTLYTSIHNTKYINIHWLLLYNV